MKRDFSLKLRCDIPEAGKTKIFANNEEEVSKY
jgi:hypothetical protein